MNRCYFFVKIWYFGNCMIIIELNMNFEFVGFMVFVV